MMRCGGVDGGGGAAFASASASAEKVHAALRRGKVPLAALLQSWTPPVDAAAAVAEDATTPPAHPAPTTAELQAGMKDAKREANETRTTQARSIHWSPYDRVGVVNADP